MLKVDPCKIDLHLAWKTETIQNYCREDLDKKEPDSPINMIANDIKLKKLEIFLEILDKKFIQVLLNTNRLEQLY